MQSRQRIYVDLFVHVFIPKFIGYDNPHHNNGNNGFGMDSTLNTLNGISNIPASVANSMIMGVPALPSLTQSNALPSASSESISTSAGK